MLVKCIKTYNDLQLKKQITPKDDFYEVTEERAKELFKAGVAEAVVIETKPENTETKPKKRTKKGE